MFLNHRLVLEWDACANLPVHAHKVLECPVLPQDINFKGLLVRK